MKDSLKGHKPFCPRECSSSVVFLLSVSELALGKGEAGSESSLTLSVALD